MRALSDISFWRNALALIALCALAIALAGRSDAALIVAAVCAACATPILIMRARLDAQHRIERRERDRMASFDKCIVEVVQRHAVLLERRKQMLSAALEGGRLRPVWERDIARFNERLVLPAITPLRSEETQDEILDRVHLVVDEVLQKRARVA